MISLTDEELKYYKASKKLLRQVANMFWRQTDWTLPTKFSDRMTVISDKLAECVKLLEPLEEEVATTKYVQLTIFDEIGKN